MAHPFRCRECLHGQEDDQRCARCGDEQLVDVGNDEERAEFVDELQRRAVDRRKKIYLLMKIFVVAVSAIVLLVGLMVTHALGGGVLDWVVKLTALALLATAWKAIPGVYQRYFRGREELLYLRWTADQQGDGTSVNIADAG